MRLLVLFTVFLCSACGYENLKDAASNDPIRSEAPSEEGGSRVPPTPSPEESVKIVYQEINARIIEPQCLRCHSASRPRGGVILDSYESLTANLGRVQDAINGDIMPPSGPLNEELKVLFSEWVRSGAPRD